jgi:hypothetical protein
MDPTRIQQYSPHHYKGDSIISSSSQGGSEGYTAHINYKGKEKEKGQN